MGTQATRAAAHERLERCILHDPLDTGERQIWAHVATSVPQSVLQIIARTQGSDARDATSDAGGGADRGRSSAAGAVVPHTPSHVMAVPHMKGAIGSRY